MSTPLCSAEDEISPTPSVTLLSLPDEVLLLILSHLPSLSLYQCSITTTRLARLTEDTDLVADLSFRRTSGFTTFVLKDFLSPGPRLAKIMKLNLNSAYWLPAGLVTECVVRLKNLTDLHIVDIRLTANQLVSVLTNLTHLKQLSLTWCFTSKNEVEDLTYTTLEPSWCRLEGLSIHLPWIKKRGGGLDLLTWVLALCNSLEQLVVLSVKRWKISDNIVINNLRPMYFPCLKGLVLNLDRDGTLASSLVHSFKESIVAAVSSFQLKQVRCSDYPADLPHSTCFFKNSANNNSSRFGEWIEYLKENKKVAKKIHSYLTPADVDRLLSTPLSSLTELSVKCSVDSIKNLLEKKDWGNLKLLELLTTDGTQQNTKVIRHLVESDFSHLTSLSIHLCFLLELEIEQLSTKVLDNLKEVEINQALQQRKQTSNMGLLLLAQNCPQLNHLEVKGHPKTQDNGQGDHCSSCGLMEGEKLLEVLPLFTELRTLTILDIRVVNFNQFGQTSRASMFREIFLACENLKELYISNLGDSCKELVRDLALGLEVAQSLTILRVDQLNLTHPFSRVICVLLASLEKGCPLLDQLVLVDPAKYINIPPEVLIKLEFITQLLDMVKTKDLSLLHVFSRLFTTENIEKLKEGLKEHAECSPHFVSYESLMNIPGVFLKTIVPQFHEISYNITFDESF